MSQDMVHWRISPPPTLALALVASFLIPAVHAQSNLGSDAPGSAPAGDDGASAANNAAGASGNDGGLSKTAQIVIGVVVGVVSLLVIAGCVYFFFRKKRMWDEQARRYETIHAYRQTVNERRQHEMSLRTQRRRNDRSPDIEDQQQRKEQLEGKTEVSENMYPKYDPATFHRTQHSIDSSRGLSIDMARQSFMSQHYNHQRNSSQMSGIIPPPPLPPAAAAIAGAGSRDSGPSPTGDDSGHSNSSSPDLMLPSSKKTKTSVKGPKKPKPVLTRLITNL